LNVVLEKLKLGEVAQIIMGQSPPGSTYNELGEGIPFFQGVADFGPRFPSPRVYCTAPTRFAEPGDILLSVRAPIGRINRCDERCSIGRGLCAVRAFDTDDQTYLEYSLRSMESSWDSLEGQGSVFGNARKEDLENLWIIWPEKSARERIAGILWALDDKIECNRRINQTLEKMAMALYKHWFVDFGPFRNGKFVDSELGPIPKGWHICTIGDLCELAYGKGLPESRRVCGPYPVYGSASIIGSHNEYLVKAPGIIVGRKGTIGKLHRAKLPFFPIDTTYYVIPKASEYTLNFLFLMLGRLDLEKRNSDSAVPGLNRNDVYRLSVIKPPKLVLEDFDAKVACLFSQIDSLNFENETLSNTRDYLLPKLLSGEIEVGAVSGIP